jgi:hypothetical protein
LHAGRHGLHYACEASPDDIKVTVRVPSARAAKLAFAISDIYDTLEAAANDVHPPMRPREPDVYECTFEFVEDPDAVADLGGCIALVDGADDDNQAAWSCILSLADAVTESLGGRWE